MKTRNLVDMHMYDLDSGFLEIFGIDPNNPLPNIRLGFLRIIHNRLANRNVSGKPRINLYFKLPDSSVVYVNGSDESMRLNLTGKMLRENPEFVIQKVIEAFENAEWRKRMFCK